GDPVYMMGHPRGLPLKTASGMVVKEPGPVNFRADVDAMRDSPGSPIFDAGHKLAGILVGGDSDWVLDEANGCLAAKPGSPKQETAVRIDRLPDPAGPWPKP
ncbi:MAG TPA: hypothetical protein VEH84_19570, partial [Alphaproteobacteria bacterium]|nr:hypothetical protein [Alphaproteobacteria bacterium]